MEDQTAPRPPGPVPRRHLRRPRTPLLARLAFADLFDKDEPAGPRSWSAASPSGARRGYASRSGRSRSPAQAPTRRPHPRTTSPANRASSAAPPSLRRSARPSHWPPRGHHPAAGRHRARGIARRSSPCLTPTPTLADYDLVRWLRRREPATLAADYAALARAGSTRHARPGGPDRRHPREAGAHAPLAARLRHARASSSCAPICRDRRRPRPRHSRSASGAGTASR